eukprot:12556534-Alexandrium_andersonii.AAC.1
MCIRDRCFDSLIVSGDGRHNFDCSPLAFDCAYIRVLASGRDISLVSITPAERSGYSLRLEGLRPWRPLLSSLDSGSLRLRRQFA